MATGKLYNLQNDYEYGAILNLAQHHGYATPLLDWTESPFIAAFFAFWRSDFSDAADTANAKVRIYEFDFNKWSINNPLGRPVIDTPGPNISALKLPSLDNSRAIPQQSVVLFSNVVDIEEHIHLHEIGQKTEYIKRIDLPLSEKDKALCEMRLMGITSASMFPGLDGICEELRDRHFNDY